MPPRTTAPPHAIDPAPEDQAFRFRNGDHARSLQEFVDVLQKLPADDVDYHRNHYHHWLNDVVGDEGFARRVELHAQGGMDADELRRTIVDLGSNRLDELRAPKTPPAKKGVKSPAKKSAGKKSAAKKAAKKPGVKQKGKKL